MEDFDSDCNRKPCRDGCGEGGVVADGRSVCVLSARGLDSWSWRYGDHGSERGSQRRVSGGELSFGSCALRDAVSLFIHRCGVRRWLAEPVSGRIHLLPLAILSSWVGCYTRVI